MNPVSDLVRAIIFPFKFVFVVGICWFINAMTSPDEHWWYWVAFGMTIALVVNLMRGLRAIVTTAGVAGVGYLAYRWWTKRSMRKSADANVVDV